MKTVYKFLVLSVMMAAVVIANASPSFAQDTDEKTDLYTKFIGCYKETDKQKKAACYAIAKQYLDKFGSDTDQYVDFVKKKYDAYTKETAEAALYDRFNKAVQTPPANSDEAFASGRDIIARYPDLIDVPIVLASIGFDNAVANPPNDKYVNDTINYAKMAIQKIEAGKTSDNYGAYSYSYKTKEYPDAKNNTLGWMNYIIGYVMYNRLNQKKDALPYLYKASQLNSATKNIPDLYQAIGNYYVDEFIRLDKDRVAKIEAAGHQDTDETKAMLDLQRGYADRALEAFAKAYKVAPDDPKVKAYKDSLLSRAKELYGIRYNNDMSGFDAYMSGIAGKPITNPSVAVTPIELAPTGSTTSSTTPSTATTMTNTTTAPKSNTARPASTTSTDTKTTTTPAKTTTPKKPSKR